MKDKNVAYVTDMLHYSHKVVLYLSRLKPSHENGQTHYTNNMMVVEACLFNITKISDAVIRLDEDFKEKHQTIPWSSYISLSNRLNYASEDERDELVLDAARNDIDLLYSKLPAFLRKVKGPHDPITKLEKFLNKAYEESLDEGIEEGMKIAGLKIAKRMLDDGHAIEQIAECLKTSVDELREGLFSQNTN